MTGRSGPRQTLWACEPHTAAKHALLLRYLHAWFPIMAGRNQALNLIDGFAGPGRYEGGEKGSPLLMLDAYLKHRRRTAKMDALRVAFDFIEVEPDRVDWLRKEVAALSLPSNVQVEVHQGSFDEVMARILDAIPPAQGLAPTFAFIDPFGYTGHSLQLSSRILQFRKCEVLIYVPLPFISRFVDKPEQEPALTNLFGDDSWKAARGHAGLEAHAVLHGLFLERVRRAAGHAISFEVDAATGKGWRGYTLYFGTSHPTGLDRMKEAMWKVDPAGGTKFAYVSDPSQMTMFEAAPDLRALEEHLAGRFGSKPFTIEQAVLVTARDTPFASRVHLKEKTLAPAEMAGRMEAWHPMKPKRRRGTYPEGTVLRFRSAS